MLLSNEIFTKKEAAEYLKINPQVMERYLRVGEIPAKKVGRQWRISRLALELWLAPSLAGVLGRLMKWEEIFDLGKKLRTDLKTEAVVLKRVKEVRRKHGIKLKGSTGH